MKKFWLINRISNRLNKYTGRKRGHYRVLKKYMDDIIQRFDKPVIIETGCIRNLNEGTESTLTISSILKDKGKFYSFELFPEHIAICKELCGDNNKYINYVQGDSVENLRKMVEDKTLSRIDMAFFDSVNNGDHIMQEFKTVENLFQPGALAIVDDVLWADKGRVIRPYLENSPQWQTKIYNVENGIMVARKLP